MASGHIDPRAALKPLSAHAWAVLTHLARAPAPRFHINAGVVDRFLREGLVDVGLLEGRKGYHVSITDAGRKKLEDRESP